MTTIPGYDYEELERSLTELSGLSSLDAATQVENLGYAVSKLAATGLILDIVRGSQITEPLRRESNRHPYASLRTQVFSTWQWEEDRRPERDTFVYLYIACNTDNNVWWEVEESSYDHSTKRERRSVHHEELVELFTEYYDYDGGIANTVLNLLFAQAKSAIGVRQEELAASQQHIKRLSTVNTLLEAARNQESSSSGKTEV